MSERTPASRDGTSANRWMVGKLSTWPLLDMLRWLHLNGRSAVLRIGIPPNEGIVVVEDGNICACAWRQTAGEVALLGLLSLKEASFTILRGEKVPLLRNIVTATPELLLQSSFVLSRGARRIDQA
jgi:hypothetical protein